MADADGDTASDSPVSDRDLVKAMQVPGSDAFTILFRRHVKAVHGYLLSALVVPGSEENPAEPSNELDDVLQETFAAAWLKLTVEKMPGASALPWLLATAQHKASNANRSRGRSRLVSWEDADPVASDTATEAVLRGERSAALQLALEALDPDDRRIVYLCLHKGLLYKEAAAQTKTSPSAVRNRLYRARQSLRRTLAPLLEDTHDR